MLFWKTYPKFAARNPSNCFNPYFVGCYSGRLVKLLRERIYLSFQSLFCWMLFWKIEPLLKIKGKGKFQSLFCWMLFWKMILSQTSSSTNAGFNPYFVGCYSGSNLFHLIFKLLILFQSLFCWMLFWKQFVTLPFV